VLNYDWQTIKHLIFKLKIKDMLDVRFLQLKLKELERKKLINAKVIQGRHHWKIYEEKYIDEDRIDIDKMRQNGYDHQEANEFDRAIECFEKVLEYIPDDIDSLNCLGDIYINNLNDYNKAIECYRTLVELEPSNRDA